MSSTITANVTHVVFKATVYGSELVTDNLQLVVGTHTKYHLIGDSMVVLDNGDVYWVTCLPKSSEHLELLEASKKATRDRNLK